jgi:predicted exporter
MESTEEKPLTQTLATLADDHAEAGEPHMPAPSLSPLILAAGMTMAAFGIVLGPALIILGAIGILVGLGTWLYDEIVSASVATEGHGSDDAHGQP